MRKQRSWQIVVLCVVLVGLFLSSAVFPFARQAGQAFAQSDSEDPHPVVQAYAEALGISYEEAERRLIIQNEMDVLGRKIAEGEPNSTLSPRKSQKLPNPPAFLLEQAPTSGLAR